MNEPQHSEQRSAARIIARNTAFSLAGQISLRLVSFIFHVLVVRVLGGEEFGQYSIVLAWAGLFSVLGDLGINQYFAREIARDHNRSSEFFWDIVSLRLLLAVFASVVTTGGAILNGYSTEIVIAVGLYTLTYVFAAILAPLQSIAFGNERLGFTASLEIIGQIITIAAGVLFLFAGLGFIWLVVASFLSFPVLIGLSIWYVRRNRLSPPPFQLHLPQWRAILLAGLPFGFIQLALSFSFRVDTIFLSSYVSDEQVGWYNVAYGLTLTFMTLTRAFNMAILPTLAREHAANPERIRPWYYRSVKMLAFLGLPIAVGGMLLAHSIIVLLYGPENAPAAVVFMVIIWDLPFLMYTSFCGNMTTSIKREQGAARIYGSLAVLNVAVNLILIPRFGVIGAAFATVLTDAVGAAQFYLLFRRTFGAGLGFKRLVRLGAAAALTGVVIFVLADANILLVLAAAGVSYLALIWLLRAFTIEERALFAHAFRRLARR